MGVAAVLVFFVNLGEEPAARDDGVGLEELERRRGAHLRRDDAHQIVFDGHDVDGGRLGARHLDAKIACKSLVFFAFPVEVDTDDDVFDLEGRRLVGAFEVKSVVEAATVEDDGSIVEGDGLRAAVFFAGGGVAAVEHDFKPRGE